MFSLDYKRWKKMTKQLVVNGGKNVVDNVRRCIDTLDAECAEIDEIYTRSVKTLLRHPSNALVERLSALTRFMDVAKCRVGATTVVIPRIRDWKTLHEFASLCRKTASKIAKRIDKALRANLLMMGERDRDEKDTGTISAVKWLREAVSSGRHAFLANDATWKLLELRSKAENGADACPICLEDTFQDCVITKCGHAFCRACVLDMVRRRHANGTLSNLIRKFEAETDSRCPLCRRAMPFSDYIECRRE